MNEKMKKILSFFIAFCLFAIAADAQKGFDPEKFRADLHKYITAEAHLTPVEAERFFPLYDEMKAKQMKLGKNSVNRHKKPTTEAACRAAIIKADEIEVKRKQIERTYHLKFLKVLSASKLYDVLLAESKFHKKVFKDVARRGKKHK